MSLIAQLETVTGVEGGVERALDLVGVFVFAVSGSLLAVRKGYDVVGVVALGLVTALGGGLMRETILGSTPGMDFRRQWDPGTPLGGAWNGLQRALVPGRSARRSRHGLRRQLVDRPPAGPTCARVRRGGA